jgi:hypothetical protein
MQRSLQGRRKCCPDGRVHDVALDFPRYHLAVKQAGRLSADWPEVCSSIAFSGLHFSSSQLCESQPAVPTPFQPNLDTRAAIAPASTAPYTPHPRITAIYPPSAPKVNCVHNTHTAHIYCHNELVAFLRRRHRCQSTTSSTVPNAIASTTAATTITSHPLRPRAAIATLTPRYRAPRPRLLCRPPAPRTSQLLY